MKKKIVNKNWLAKYKTKLQYKDQVWIRFRNKIIFGKQYTTEADPFKDIHINIYSIILPVITYFTAT